MFDESVWWMQHISLTTDSGTKLTVCTCDYIYVLQALFCLTCSFHAHSVNKRKQINKQHFIQQWDTAAIIPNGKHAIQPEIHRGFQHAEEWHNLKDTASRFCLFQIHSRETLTKSISLPRSAYWQHITRQNSVGDLYSFQGTGMELAITIPLLYKGPRQRMQASRWSDGEAGDFFFFLFFFQQYFHLTTNQLIIWCCDVAPKFRFG